MKRTRKRDPAKISPTTLAAAEVLDLALGTVWPFAPVETSAFLPTPIGTTSAAWGMRLRRALSWLDMRYADPARPGHRFSLGVRFRGEASGVLRVSREGYPGTPQWDYAAMAGNLPLAPIPAAEPKL